MELKGLVSDLVRESTKSKFNSLLITIVDDGSGRDLDLAHIVRDMPVEILSLDTSQGAAAARNFGASRFFSEWIAFVDDDVRLPTGWLDAVHELLTSSRAHFIGGDVKSLSERNWFSQASEDFIVRHREYPEGWYLVSAHLFCRRDAFDTLNGFDAEHFRHGSEDWDLCRRAHSAGLDIQVSNAVFCKHRNPTNARDFMNRARSYGRTSHLLDPIDVDLSTEVSQDLDHGSITQTSKRSYPKLLHRAGTWPVREYRILRGLGRSRTRALRSTVLYIPWMARYLSARRKSS